MTAASQRRPHRAIEGLKNSSATPIATNVRIAVVEPG
jgi:hypothetical protein